MIQPVVILFVVIAVIFALIHWVALEASLYWYYWWFDVVMHLWGGFLIALGMLTLTTFRCITLTPSYRLVFYMTLGLGLGWELFEWQIGFIDPQVDWLDSLSDLVLGITGGLVGYSILRRFKI